MSFTPERTSVVQNIQIAKESTIGTPVTAGFKKLASISITPSPKISTSSFRPNGTMFSTLNPVGKDMSEGKFESTPAYEELDWILGSVLCVSASGGVYKPSAVATNTPQFYTIQSGQTGSCETYGSMVFTSATFTFNRDGVKIAGDMFGQAMSTDTGWASGATSESTITPILPKDTTITMAGSSIDPFSAEVALSNRWGDVWLLDGTDSYANIVELVPQGTATLRMRMTTAEGKAQVAALRSDNATQELKITCSDGTNSFELAAKVQISEVTELSDEGGVYAVTIKYNIVWDESAQYAIKASVA